MHKQLELGDFFRWFEKLDPKNMTERDQKQLTCTTKQILEREPIKMEFDNPKAIVIWLKKRSAKAGTNKKKNWH